MVDYFLSHPYGCSYTGGREMQGMRKEFSNSLQEVETDENHYFKSEAEIDD